MAERHDRRYAAMREMRGQGLPLREVGAAFGVSEARVIQIIGSNSAPRCIPNKRTTAEEDEAMFALYQSGLTLEEVGDRFGLSSVSVRSRFVTRDDYVPRRRCSVRAAPINMVVPAWVPDNLKSRYVHLTRYQGEHVAASCIRNAKRLGVSA